MLHSPPGYGGVGGAGGLVPGGAGGLVPGGYGGGWWPSLAWSGLVLLACLLSRCLANRWKS